jgi:hypothetical protein
MGGWVGHEGGLDLMVKKGKESCTLWGIKLSHSTCSYSLYLLSLPFV